MTEHFVTVAQMIDDLRSEDSEQRLVAVKSLALIAQTLGPERTREELLPYITDYLDDEDNYLKALASRLGALLPEVGGIAHVDALLGPLETLCTLDELTVRDASIQAITALAKTAFSPAAGSLEAQANIMAVIQRLGASDHAPSRCSACGLVAAPYASAPIATRRDIKALFVRLCDDPEVMVRRAACVALGTSVAAAVDEGIGEFIPQFGKFCKDASDSVRLQAIQAAVAISPKVSDAGLTQVIGLMKTMSADTAWRVRYMLADRIGALAVVWPPRDASKVGLAIYRSLCNDPAPEIKAAAVFNLDRLVSVIPDDGVKKDALDIAVKLVDDSTPHVRNCLATVLLKALPSLPKATWSTIVVPTCHRLLEDEDQQVRLAVVSTFATTGGSRELQPVASTLVPVLCTLAKDTNWRVRESVVEQLPAVVQSGTDINTDLMKVCVGALSDRVAAIRASGALACRQLAIRLGSSWITESLLPRIHTELGQSKGYMQRVTFLYVLRQLLEVSEPAVARSDILPLVASAATDPVANVRLNAALALRAGMAHKRFSGTEADVQSVLSKLRSDSDVDVRDAMVPPTR